MCLGSSILDPMFTCIDERVCCDTYAFFCIRSKFRYKWLVDGNHMKFKDYMYSVLVEQKWAVTP